MFLNDLKLFILVILILTPKLAFSEETETQNQETQSLKPPSLQEPLKTDEASPNWQVPLKEKQHSDENKATVMDGFQIPTSEDDTKYPISDVSFFYTPGSGAFIQKFKSVNEQMTFNTASGQSYRAIFEYKFNYHYSIGAFLNSYNFSTTEKQFTFFTMQASSNPMTSLGAFIRWTTHLTSLQKKISFDFFFTKESLPLIDFSEENDLLFQVYTFKPTFWNLAVNYQTPISTSFDALSFLQYGGPIDNPSIGGIKLKSAHHIDFGAAFVTSITEKWRIQLGFENSSYLAEAKNGNSINQSLMSSLIFKLGLTYELPQLLPDKPKAPENMNLDSEFLPGI